MEKNDRTLEKYYRQVRRMLPCSRKTRAELERQIRYNVEAFAEEHPEADAEEIRAHFGEPQAVAAAYIESADTEELLQQLWIRRRILRIASFAVALMMLTWLSLWAVALYNTAKAGEGYFIADIRQGEITYYDEQVGDYVTVTPTPNT